MFTKSLTRIIPVIFLMLCAPIAWAQRGAGWAMRQGAGQGSGICKTMIASMPKQPLDATETAQLTYLREEEKLAHDIYMALNSSWSTPVFGNIAQSEQRHSEALKVLLDRYGLPDPAADKAAGVFQNAGLTTLYEDLAAQGKASFAAALRVGATVEDLSLRDLAAALAATDNNDLKLVYQNLQNGSQNHIQAFVGRLDAIGESYEAQYINPATLAGILSVPKAAGMKYAGRGNGPRGNGPRGNGLGNGRCLWIQNP
jgi:hypothetical protein